MKRLRYFFQFLILAGFFSCSPPSDHTDRQVFRYNESSGIVSLDPAFAKDLPHIWVCNQLYNGLVSLDEQMQVVPAIAKSWQIIDEGKTYLFELRSDVYFHSQPDQSGRKVVANDFVYSFNRLVDPVLASPGSWIMEHVARLTDGKLDVMALNDTTLQIRLKESFPPFLGILSMSYAFVVPDEPGINHQRLPVGTGPFKFQFWKEGVKLVLLKNEHYFESTAEQPVPLLDAVAVNFLIDRQTAFMEFIKGNLDYMSGIDARYKDELLNRDGSLREKYANRINLIREPFMNTEYLGIFTGGEKRNSKEELMLRKAISMGIDREKMLKYLRNNVGSPAYGGMIPKGMPGHDPDIGYRYEPKEAKNIIDHYKLSGKELVISTTAEYTDLMKYIQAQLQDLSLKVRIEVMPAATLRELRSAGQLDIFRASWVADYPDAENYLSLFLSKNKSPSGPNYTHFEHPGFDALYYKAMQMKDLSDRVIIYRKLDSLMMESAPVVVLFYDEVLRFAHQSVRNLGSNPTNLLDLRHVWIEGKKRDQ